jgi:hypothetical protein
VGSDGGVFAFHGGFYGSLPGLGIHVDNVVGITPAANYGGYYLVGSDGGVFSFGDTAYEGSLPGLGIHVKDVVGIVPSSDDKGYFLVGADGGVFSFGDTAYEGSLPSLGIHVDDVVGIAATPNNTGYWVLQANGQVTAFGDAPNLAQVAPLPESSGATRYVDIASTSNGQGYWAMNNFGQVFAVGNARWLGNPSYNPSSLVSIVPTGDSAGYWIVGSNGAIFAMGDASSHGSLLAMGIVPNLPIVGAAPTVSSPTPALPPSTTSASPVRTSTSPSPAITSVGNTCGAVGSCSANVNPVGNTFGGVPETVSELAVSSDGVALSSANWEENSHNINVYAPGTGYPEGLQTGDSGPPSTSNPAGTFGLAMDSTYIYGAEGDGLMTRFSRATWLNPANESNVDEGNSTGVGYLTVDSGGNPLLGETLCDGNLFVTDANGPLTSTTYLSPNTTEIKEVPTSLSGVTETWSAPGASVLTCDREGDIWALVENPAGSSDVLERFTDTGSLVTSLTLPASVIAQGVAASPSSNELLVADNGQDQDFKWFNYSGTQTGQVGVAGGYLQGSDPGLIGPDRFVGPRSVAIDGSGNIFTAENCLPGVSQSVWQTPGPCAIISEYQSNGTSVVWRDVSANTFGGTGEPTNDGSRFFNRDFEFARDSSGSYQPYAFTVNPWAYPSDSRVSSAAQIGCSTACPQYGAGTYEWEGDGHRYETVDLGEGAVYTYEQLPGSEIMAPVWQIPNPGGWENVFVDDSTGNIWGVQLGGTNVTEYPLTGYSTNGVPEYGSLISYGEPPGLVDVRGVDVEGSTVYVTGFSSSDTDSSSVAGNYESIGPTLIKFDSLPTTSGWPSAAWTVDPTYSVNSADTTPFPQPFSFAVDSQAKTVGIALLYEPATNGNQSLQHQGALEEYSATTGAYIQTLTPPLPGSHVGEGAFDDQSGVVSKNGWFWLEDDWYTRIIGIRPST